MATPVPIKSVLTESRGGVARLVINRPPLNILDIATIWELREALEGVAQHARLIEIRGAGDKAFSAGVEIRDHFPDRAPQMLAEFHALVRAILYAHVPVVAVVQGHCLGGGMELVLASDLAVASEDARFGQPEITVGSIAPVASALLPGLVGEKTALEILLTGEAFGAAEAKRLGLINRVVTADRFEAEVRRFEDRLLAHSPRILNLARKLARRVSRATFEAALREAERAYLEELLAIEDASEGLQAFLEKRPPAWNQTRQTGEERQRTAEEPRTKSEGTKPPSH